MSISLSNHRSSARPVDCFDEDSADEARLRGLTHQQLADRLAWLGWYQPGIFNAVMDYMDFSDALAADADPANPGPVDSGHDDVLAPVCGRCGADLGIFIKFGLEWRHYREGTALGQAEIFDPGHDPELAWRLPGSAPAGT